MARVKGAMMTRKRRKKILKRAKGYWGSKKEFTEIKQKMKKASARTSRAKACFHGTTLI